MTSTIRTRRVKVKGPNQRLKRLLASRGVTYDDVAAKAGVGWFMVWAVLNKRKVSYPVMEAARALAGEGDAR